MESPQRLENVSIDLKANLYFDGRVISHSLFDANGAKKTVGVIYPGTFQFKTAAPERMILISGACKVRVAGEEEWKAYAAGMEFRVPGDSVFEISVLRGICEYLCEFL